jgi:hypothetical protein
VLIDGVSENPLFMLSTYLRNEFVGLRFPAATNLKLEAFEGRAGFTSDDGNVMDTPDSHEVTELLLAWSEGDEKALDRLMPLVYGELRRLAQSHMRREWAGHMLQTTALIHEANIRLIDGKNARLENRAHFFCCRLAADAADPGGFRPLSQLSKTRRRQGRRPAGFLTQGCLYS